MTQTSSVICMQVKLSNTFVRYIPFGSKTCIVRAEFMTPLIFTPLISSSEPRSQSDFIRRLTIHLTKRCQVSPSAINIKVPPMDLQNARAIYGPCPHCLEGKPQPSKGSHKSFDDSLKPTEPGELLHCCDIVRTIDIL